MDEEDCYQEGYSKALLIPDGPSFKVLYSAWAPPLLMYEKNSDMELLLRLGDKEIIIFDGKEMPLEDALGKMKGYLPKPYSLINVTNSKNELFKKIESR